MLELGHAHIDFATRGKVKAAIAAGKTHVAVPTDYETYANYVAAGGYEKLTALRAADGWVAVQETVLASVLCRLGRAGFLPGYKWGVERAAEGSRYLAMNDDEGEPGVFMGRH